MGDLKGLLERVNEADIKVLEAKARKFMEGKFTLRDMYDQWENVRKLGPLRKVLQMLPGGNQISEDQLGAAGEKMAGRRGIMKSMTEEALEEPRAIDGSRPKQGAPRAGRPERPQK